MENKQINFCGYFDSKSIANGFLIPVYSDEEDNYFFQELSNDESIITGFSTLKLDSYKTDTVTFIDNSLPSKIGGESYIVVKNGETTKYGMYSEISEYIYSEIESGNISSDALIRNANRIFKKSKEPIRVINDHIATVMNIKK